MKQLTYIIFLINIVNINCVAQTQYPDNSTIELCDKIYSTTNEAIKPLSKQNVIKTLGLKSLENSNDSLNIRFWYNGYLVDLRLSNKSSYDGSIYYYTINCEDNEKYIDRLNRNKKAKIPRLYTFRHDLKKIEVKDIFNSLLKDSIYSLSTRSEIKGYETILDGYWFTIELFYNGKHSCHCFDNLNGQPEIKEIKKAQQIFSILKTLPYDKVNIDLKKGNYETNAFGILIIRK